MENGVALVIGNSAYSNISRLRNPISDARSLAAMFANLGFRLVTGEALTNANKAQMDSAIKSFCTALRRDSVGLFYYAGHGIQVGGTNYLCPIEAGAAREMHIDSELISVGQLLKSMEAANAALNILILDACRSDPFANRLSLQTASGLAPMTAREGTILSYATQPGNVAYDGQGGNSPFATALLEVLPTPNLDALQAFNQVGITVRQRSGGSQVPWFSASPVLPFYFASLKTGTVEESNNRQANKTSNSWWTAATTVGEPQSQTGADIGVVQADQTLQPVIDAASTGSTLTLAPGNYSGEITINKNLTLRGSDGGPVEFDGSIEVTNAEVRIEGITIRYLGGQSAVSLNGGRGRLELTACTIVDLNPNVAIGISLGEGSVRLQRSKISGFLIGIYNNGGSVLVEGSELEGCSVRGIQGELSIGMLSSGKLEASGSKIISYRQGCGTVLSGETVLTDLTIESCSLGVVATQQGTKIAIEASTFRDVGCAVKSHDHSELTAIDCDMEFDGVGVQAESGGTVILRKCRNISGTGNTCKGVTAETEGKVHLTQCRIFDCENCIYSFAGGTINATECEVFGALVACVFSQEQSRVELEGCDIHHAKGEAGVWCLGSLEMRKCRLRDNDRHGLALAEHASASLANCGIYRNSGDGVVLWQSSSVQIAACEIVLNRQVGLRLKMKARGSASDCVIRQNPASVFLHDSVNALIRGSDLRGPWNPSIHLCDHTARVEESGNQLTPEHLYQPSEGSGGRLNEISLQDFVYADRGSLLDVMRNYFQTSTLFRSWRTEIRTSTDGGTITFVLTRSFEKTVQARALSMGSRIAERWRASRQQSQISVVTAMYELRTTVTVDVRSRFPGLDRIELSVLEEESIDPSGMLELSIIGRDWAVPSDICMEQRGRRLLYDLVKHFTPAT